jgi:NADP-dependent 3-hydroxy acid dehydrogenase YdfG
MDLGIEGKRFLITGGSSGLGKALAARLLREGAAVALMARDEQRLSAAASELRTAGEVIALPGDVRRDEDLERFVAAACKRWGGVDGVANNAGELAGGAFVEHTTTRFGSRTCR